MIHGIFDDWIALGSIGQHWEGTRDTMMMMMKDHRMVDGLGMNENDVDDDG